MCSKHTLGLARISTHPFHCSPCYPSRLCWSPLSGANLPLQPTLTSLSWKTLSPPPHTEVTPAILVLVNSDSYHPASPVENAASALVSHFPTGITSLYQQAAASAADTVWDFCGGLITGLSAFLRLSLHYFSTRPSEWDQKQGED